VRELKNLIERLYILVSSNKISPEDIYLHLPEIVGRSEDVININAEKFKDARLEFERKFLKEQLDKMGWNISNTAEKLGMQQPNLSRKINDLGIKKTKLM
jgi:two-component system nitrogen regulation response regulator NtrX